MTSIPAFSANCANGASYAVTIGNIVRPLRRLIAPAVTRRTVPFSGSYGRASIFPGCTMWLATMNGPSVTPRGTHSFSYYDSDALHSVRMHVGKLRTRRNPG